MATVAQPARLNGIPSFIGKEFALSLGKAILGDLELRTDSHGKSDEVRIHMVPIRLRAVSANLGRNVAKLTTRC